MDKAAVCDAPWDASTSQGTKQRLRDIKATLKLQRHLAKWSGRDLANISEAVVYAGSHGYPRRIEKFWELVGKRNSAEHSDFLNRGFPVETRVQSSGKKYKPQL